jgi:hypothetical protein
MNLTMEMFPLGYPVHYGLLPQEYAAWAFLGFVIFGIAALVYGFYFITTFDMDGGKKA